MWIFFYEINYMYPSGEYAHMERARTQKEGEFLATLQEQPPIPVIENDPTETLQAYFALIPMEWLPENFDKMHLMDDCACFRENPSQSAKARDIAAKVALAWNASAESRYLGRALQQLRAYDETIQALIATSGSITPLALYRALGMDDPHKKAVIDQIRETLYTAISIRKSANELQTTFGKEVDEPQSIEAGIEAAIDQQGLKRMSDEDMVHTIEQMIDSGVLTNEEISSSQRFFNKVLGKLIKRNGELNYNGAQDVERFRKTIGGKVLYFLNLWVGNPNLRFHGALGKPLADSMKARNNIPLLINVLHTRLQENRCDFIEVAEAFLLLAENAETWAEGEAIYAKRSTEAQRNLLPRRERKHANIAYKRPDIFVIPNGNKVQDVAAHVNMAEYLDHGPSIVRRFYKLINHMGEQGAAKAIRDPEHNKRMLRGNLKQALRLAEGGNDDDLKRLMQEWTIYIVGGEHASVPIPGARIPVPFLDFDFLFLHIHRQLPLFISTVVSFFGFNTRNVRAAIQQGRIGKAIWYSLLTLGSPIPLPIFNTLYWETIDFLKQNAKRRKLTQAVFASINEDGAHAKAYKDGLNHIFGNKDEQKEKIAKLNRYQELLLSDLSELGYQHDTSETFKDKPTLMQNMAAAYLSSPAGRATRNWEVMNALKMIYHTTENWRIAVLGGIIYDNTFCRLPFVGNAFKALRMLSHVKSHDVQRLLVHEYLEINEKFLALAGMIQNG